jgi:quinoprotein glucose dehydrogenase
MQHRSVLALAVAVLLGLCGLALLAGGLWLAGLGGSWYYLLAGAALLFDAWWLWRGRRGALLLFAAIVAATLCWALWEAGLDWWPLAARMDVLFVLGLLLLLPGIARHLGGPARLGRFAIAVVLAAFAAVSVASWLRDPHDISGALAASTGATAPGGMAAADWTAYGGSAFGQRYSALRQITPENVRQLQPAWHYQTGDRRGQPGDPVETTFEVTPL